MPDGSATANLYRPKLVTIFTEGYGFSKFRSDLVAALTVSIVALPLSMAIAVASGVTPERGLYTSIVGGFLVSLLGGSRFQIGGPAGAFIILVAATGSKYGLQGLLLTVLLSGGFLTILGALRIGSLIRHIPHAVTVGFTCGIAVTILGSQLKDFSGLHLTVPEPGPLIPKLGVLLAAAPTWNPAALGVGIGSAFLIFLIRIWKPTWPGMLIAVVTASLAVTGFHLPVETIGTRFGGLPHSLPTVRLPPISPTLLMQVLPAALSFTLLGGIESLLSAKVADSMTGRKHRSNMELIAQGIANMASALFGGISVTGTIARTATNIRAGAQSPISGMLHSGFLLLFIMMAARLASYVPLASLAGILVVVCWNMAEKKEFWRLLGYWHEALVLIVTFAFTLIKDLTFGIVAGCLLAAVFALLRRGVSEEGA